MSINKNLTTIFLITFLIFLHNVRAENHTELTSLDDELPAIDPFSSGNLGGSNIVAGSSTEDENNNILNNLRLVATIVGEDKKIAVFAMANGSTMKFLEEETIAVDTILTRIDEDSIYIKSNDDEYQVFMNNQIIQVE